MDISIILVKICGFLLFVWTLYSIYRHFSQKKKGVLKDKENETSSTTEKILNSILLYLWLAFLLVFSLGMIFNN
ncbi:MAG: hypothetical protein N2053_09640 [Chitinispirillaceae bacterium]|nr:hypothetical protein [Chitinispirillaceae bacterium]